MKPTTTKSTTSGEGGGTDEEDTRPSSHRRRRSRSSSWLLLLLGLTALLATAQPVVGAVPRPADAATNDSAYLADAIDIPSGPANSAVREKAGSSQTASAITRTTNESTPDVRYDFSSSRYDIEITKDSMTLLVKKSKATDKAFADFAAKNCHDIENTATFLQWEHEQFTQALKSTLLATSRPDQVAEDRATLNALLQSDEEALKSLCKPHINPWDEAKLLHLSMNDKVENALINLVFGDMFHRGNRYMDYLTGLIIERKPDRPVV